MTDANISNTHGNAICRNTHTHNFRLDAMQGELGARASAEGEDLLEVQPVVLGDKLRDACQQLRKDAASRPDVDLIQVVQVGERE